MFGVKLILFQIFVNVPPTWFVILFQRVTVQLLSVSFASTSILLSAVLYAVARVSQVATGFI
ncbi:TPA: hypothetical protein DCZ31_00810 [Patescibacteria group bacterium]|nr:hypothetical protein [Candidatus Gracilibacteria bacterium]